MKLSQQSRLVRLPVSLPVSSIGTRPIAIPVRSNRALRGTVLLWGIVIGSIFQMWTGSSMAQTPPVTTKPAATQQRSKHKTAARNAWKPLFDGKTLKDWKITNFGGEGEVVVEKGVIVMGMGSSMTGITYIGKMPKCDYEVRLEAMRIDGIDFFATTTFPVNDSFCSLVVGGWAGPVVGISCIDFADASENETTSYQKFKAKKWYRIRIQVRNDHIGAWIDDKQVVDLHLKGHKLSTRAEVSLNEPFGVSCWETNAGIRKIELRTLPRESSKK